jgi:ABC-type multidrug transport system permease subunit
VSSASSNVSIALALAPVSVIPMMLFGGLFLNVESIPKYFYWVSYLSWFYYGFEALSINEWDGFAAGNIPFSVLSVCTPSTININLITYSLIN